MGKEIRNENIDKEVLTNQELDNTILDNKILNKKELVSNKSIIDSDSLKLKSQKLTKKLGKILVVVIILTIIAASIKYRKSRVAWYQGIDVNIENYTKGPTIENSAGKMLCNLIGKEEKAWIVIAIYLVAIAIGIYDIAWEVFEHIIHLQNPIDEHLLMCISVSGAFCIAFFKEAEPVFFDGIMVLVLFQVG